ncbi:GNAT family N-acetyltransferase [Actinoplanes sp. NPDC026670]|uniref:GNAT family N-acetyltransferase n=1 Tax=Actinoplanes sp. NPDC026670 TaxID=3154700 RepID=UPI0033E94CD0
MSDVVHIELLTDADHAEWSGLARRFNDHFGTAITDELYERTWHRLIARDEIRGAGAWADGRMVGLAHYYFHTGLWFGDRCFLADLFVAPEARRRGVATAMLSWIAGDAAEHGITRFYWNTEHDNAGARALYDTVADYRGLIVYTYRTPLGREIRSNTA